MWKILIVEDEPFVRRSIIQLIDWRSMGFDIVAEADDGEDALEQMKIHQPDLVISDIVMPHMDGLELLRRAKEAGFEGIFIMLTCMNEFEYARQALEYGASGYVLKLSMSPDSMRQALDKVSMELSRKQSLRSTMQFHEAYESAWNAFAAQSGNPQPAHSSISRPVAEWSRYRCVSVCCVFHGQQPFVPAQYADWFGLETASGPDLHSFSAYGVTTLFHWSDRPLKLKLSAQPLTAWPVICSGTVETGLFPDVWFQALRQLNPHWYRARPGIYWLRSDTGEQPVSDALSWKREMELYRLMESGKKDAAAELLGEAWTQMEREQVPWVTVKDTAIRIAKWAQRQLPAIAPQLLQHTADSVTHEELLSALTGTVEQYMNVHAKESYPLTDHPEINRVLQYMHEHYQDQLTLKTLAGHVSMDEKYLSGLFVKKRGEPLIQYLQRIRVEKAKQLLSDTDLPVNEIGELVGFANANYFFKIFKRWSELTPNDYRKLYGSKSR